MSTPLYDSLSQDYDRFVNWADRLEYELPFIEAQLQAVGAQRVLDVACGSGMHAIALARRGYQVAGSDISKGMIAQAQANARAAELEIPFLTVGFGGLAASSESPFDAILCLGNSLPHVLTAEELEATLLDMATALRPDGLLMLQSRNFDTVLTERNRWMSPQAFQSGGEEWLFVRFYDYERDGTLTFNVLTLHRSESAAWEQHQKSTQLRPWRQHELIEALKAAGFGRLHSYGNMKGADHQVGSSDLVLTARRSGSLG